MKAAAQLYLNGANGDSSDAVEVAKQAGAHWRQTPEVMDARSSRAWQSQSHDCPIKSGM